MSPHLRKPNNKTRSMAVGCLVYQLRLDQLDFMYIECLVRMSPHLYISPVKVSRGVDIRCLFIGHNRPND